MILVCGTITLTFEIGGRNMKEKINNIICMQSKRKAILFIFITALLFRLIGLFFVDIHSLEYGDMTYQTIVENLLDGNGYIMGKRLAYRPPLFPLIHAGISAVFGRDNILALRFFFILIGSVTCIGIYLIARDIFELKLAILTGLWLAISPQHIWYSIHILSECPYTLFLVFFLYFLLKAVHKNKLILSCVAGILLGLSLLTRSILAGFLPFIFLWVLIVYKKKLTALKHFALLLIFALLIISPWVIRNYMVLDTFIPFSTDGAEALIYANNPGVLHSETGFCGKCPAEVAKGLGEIERQRAYYNFGLNFIKNNPDEFLRNAMDRFIQLWRPFPNVKFPQVKPIYAIVYFLSYLPVLILLFIGMPLSLRQLRYTGLMYLLVIYCTGVHMVLPACIRYREPLMPLLILFAVFGITQLKQYRYVER